MAASIESDFKIFKWEHYLKKYPLKIAVLFLLLVSDTNVIFIHNQQNYLDIKLKCGQFCRSKSIEEQILN